MRLSLVCGLVVALVLVHSDQALGRNLKIGAFNIQVFGRRKMRDRQVVTTICKILNRYDLVLIQEIRDASGRAIRELLTRCNCGIRNRRHAFRSVVSRRLGRTASKEQYAFFYRASKLSIASQFQYPTFFNRFERPPFGILFNAPGHSIRKFGFLGIHTKPSNAIPEINSLTDAYNRATRAWNTQDIIIGGDFNAGCRYASVNSLRRTSLRSDRRFRWVIGDNARTTPTGCPYDRFVLGGSRLRTYFAGANVYNYRWSLGVSASLARRVSDHYPIEMELR